MLRRTVPFIHMSPYTHVSIRTCLHSYALTCIVYFHMNISIQSCFHVPMFHIPMQRLYMFLVYERFVEHKIHQFVDLCSVSNVREGGREGD